MENGVPDVAPLEENFIVDRYYKKGFSNKYGKLDWKYIKQIQQQTDKRF